MWALKRIGVIMVLAACLVGCQKDATIPVDAENDGSQESGLNPGITGPRLSYPDSIFYLQAVPGDYTVLPATKRDQAGYFRSFPNGLALDSATGRINVTQSESGLRYKIYQISNTGVVLDSFKIVISGIDYYDAIYEISTTPNRYDTAFPVYNARPELALPCGNIDVDGDGDVDDDDDDNGCVFDETDLDNDGNDDIAGVIQDKLLVDIKKGTIDIEASFNAGIFGSSDPANGLSKDFTMYYRLLDASNRALNKITVRVMHYRRKSDIPQSLLETLNLRKNLTLAVNKVMTPVSGNAAAQQVSGLRQEYTPAEIYDLGAKPKRPPIIIIVSQ